MLLTQSLNGWCIARQIESALIRPLQGSLCCVLGHWTLYPHSVFLHPGQGCSKAG